MIFYKTIRNEMSQVASGVFIALLTIVITVSLIRSLGQAANGRIDSQSVVQFLLFSTLTYIPVVMVLTVFLSVLITLSRCFRENEMVAWWFAGQSILAWVPPVLRFAMLFTLVATVFSVFITPWARTQTDEAVQRFQQRADIAKISAGQFRESTDGARVFFTESQSDDRRQIEQVFVLTQTPNQISMVSSAGGEIQIKDNGERFLVLESGSRYDLHAQEGRFDVMRFDAYGIRLEPGFYLPPDPRLQSMSLPLLWADGSLQARGEILWRFGLPISALILALLAIPLSFVNPRAGSSLNLVFALLIYFFYSNLISIAQVWVSRGKIDFMWAFGAPHALGLVVFGFMIFLRLQQPRTLFWYLGALRTKLFKAMFQ